RLSQGQELVYRGTIQEEALGKGVQYSHSYGLESRVFVLEKSTRGYKVAFYTVLKLRSARPEKAIDAEPSSVRLEVTPVDLHGRVLPEPGESMALPSDGPATVECGAFVEFPDERL